MPDTTQELIQEALRLSKLIKRAHDTFDAMATFYRHNPVWHTLRVNDLIKDLEKELPTS